MMQEIDNPIESGDPAKESIPWLQQLFEPVNEWLTHFEKPIFDQILDFMLPFNQWMNQLPPVVWRLSAVGLFVLAALAALCIPRSYIFVCAGSKEMERSSPLDGSRLTSLHGHLLLPVRERKADE